jgi:hypothetical protein
VFALAFWGAQDPKYIPEVLTSAGPEMVIGVCQVTEGWAFALVRKTAAPKAQTITELIILLCIIAR